MIKFQKLIAYKDEENKECQIYFFNYENGGELDVSHLKYNIENKKTLSEKEVTYQL